MIIDLGVNRSFTPPPSSAYNFTGKTSSALWLQVSTSWFGDAEGMWYVKFDDSKFYSEPPKCIWNKQTYTPPTKQLACCKDLFKGMRYIGGCPEDNGLPFSKCDPT